MSRIGLTTAINRRLAMDRASDCVNRAGHFKLRTAIWLSFGLQYCPPNRVGPSGRTGSGYWIDRLPGVLLLKLYRAESGVQPTGIAFDEPGNVFDDVGECLERHCLDALDLQRLHKIFCLGVVVRISSPTQLD